MGIVRLAGAYPQGCNVLLLLCQFQRGIVLPPPEDSLGMWLPPSINYMNMTDSLNNVGGMLNKYDVRRNIELVRFRFSRSREHRLHLG